MNSKLQELKKLAVILTGNTVLAFGVAAFVIPNGLISGGSTGLALFFSHQFHVPVTLFVSCLNGLTFLLGAIFLGKKFAVTTLVSTFYYPIALGFFQGLDVIQNLTDDLLLASVYAGLLLGCGVGIVLKMGASTGGMDIPPLIISSRTGVAVSKLMYLFDTSILLLQVTYSDSERILYGILVVMITSLMINQVLVMGKTQTKVEIISDKYEEINQQIQTRIDRGSTLVETVTGHYQKSQRMVMTVISHRELPRLNRLVLDIDPKAFMVISQVNEVKGRGFSLDKREP